MKLQKQCLDVEKVSLKCAKDLSQVKLENRRLKKEVEFHNRKINE
jgi:hypothetical protein